MPEGSFFSELRKRKVLQTAAIYGAVAWGVTEVVVTVVEQLFLPQWVSTLAVIFFVVGFPVAMFLSWTFDFTTEGIQRTAVSSRKGAASIVASMVLLISGTAGLFFLIKPGLQLREAEPGLVAILPNSVAVLPFVNVGGNPEDTYLVAGLSDELRDQLGRVSGLRIAARSSSVAAMEQSLAAQSISQTLGVAKWVEGSVRRQGNLLTVSAQLIDGNNGLALWNEKFERGPQELLNVQQAIAEAVIRHVLPDAEGVIPEPATRDPTANESMMLARHLEQLVRERGEVDKGVLLEAIRHYRKATESDPGSALAHSRLAGALIYLGDVDAAEAPIFRALSINPNLSEVQITLGEFHWARGLTKEGRAAWARAVELDSNNPEALSGYAISHWFQIEREEVAAIYRHALSLDPLNLERYAELGAFLALESYTDEARELVTTIEELFDGAAAYRVLADLSDYLGDVDTAIAWTIRARNLEPDKPGHVQKLAEYFADIGDHETALRLDPNGIGVLFKLRRFEEMIDLAEFAMIDQPGDMRLRAVLAIAYNAVGRLESAIHVLRTTGLADSGFNGLRNTAEVDAYLALVNALYAFGQVGLAHELASLIPDNIGYAEGYNWLAAVAGACAFAIRGDEDMARSYLEKAQKSTQLAWDPVLRDSPCFSRLQEDPVYQATVRYFDDRRKLLKERLPATLAEFGVSL
jgi:TolB-like protein/tetratricopeptide (TPR) repeat protein